MDAPRGCVVTRSELIDRLHMRKIGYLTRYDIERFVVAVEAEITACLVAGEDVVLLGFGKFETRERKQHSAPKHRPGTAGATPDRMVVPAHRVARFVAGSKLKAAVRGNTR